MRWWIAPVVAATLLAACAEPTSARVGIVLGGEGERAAVLAAEDVNAAGGRRIELKTLSRLYGTSAEEAITGAESLVVDPRVLGVVGHANSSASLAASQIYNAQHVVQIAPTSTSPLYSRAGPYSYRMVGSDAHQAKFLARQITRPAAEHIAIIYANDDYGRALRGLVTAELAALGSSPIYQGPYAESETDGTDVLHALVRAKPTTLLWLGRAPFMALIARPLRAALPQLRIIASDGFASPAAEHYTDGRFAGVRYVRLATIDTTDPIVRRLAERYRAAGGGDLTDQAALSYDAVLLLGAAMREAGANREAIRTWLDQLGRSHPPFHGVTGTITFTPDGDRAPSYQIVTAGRGAR